MDSILMVVGPVPEPLVILWAHRNRLRNSGVISGGYLRIPPRATHNRSARMGWTTRGTRVPGEFLPELDSQRGRLL